MKCTYMSWSDKNWPNSFSSLWQEKSFSNYCCFLLQVFLKGIILYCIYFVDCILHNFLILCELMWIFNAWFLLILYPVRLLHMTMLKILFVYNIYILYKILERELQFHNFSTSATGYWIILVFIDYLISWISAIYSL